MIYNSHKVKTLTIFGFEISFTMRKEILMKGNTLQTMPLYDLILMYYKNINGVKRWKKTLSNPIFNNVHKNNSSNDKIKNLSLINNNSITEKTFKIKLNKLGII